MKHSSFLFKKIVFVLCFFVLPNLSAMVNDVNKRINDQRREDIRAYNVHITLGNPMDLSCTSGFFPAANVLQCWFLFPKVVVLSKDFNTNNFNLVYDGEIKASGENISVTFDEIMGTNDTYPGLSLNVNNNLDRNQISNAVKYLHDAVKDHILRGFLATAANN